MSDLKGYDLSRTFFNWCFENPEKVNPNHIAMYFFIVEHCNRLGWKEKFGLPTTMVKDAIGIRNYRTYINTLNDLVNFGFIKMLEKSKNQYSSNIIAIVKNTKAPAKALDKALQKHSQKQGKSIDSIDKQETNNKELIYKTVKHLSLSVEEFDKLIKLTYTKEEIDDILDSISTYDKFDEYKSLYRAAKTWLKNNREWNKGKPQKQDPQKSTSVSGSASDLIKQGITDFCV